MLYTTVDMPRPVHELWAAEICVYCGEMADSRDHVPPTTVALRIGMRRKVVSACRECNLLLGPRPPWYSILARRRKIAEILRRRYSKVLRIPPWTEEEIQAFGPNLERSVREGLSGQRRARRRIAFASAGSAVVNFVLASSTSAGAPENVVRRRIGVAGLGLELPRLGPRA